MTGHRQRWGVLHRHYGVAVPGDNRTRRGLRADARRGLVVAAIMAVGIAGCSAGNPAPADCAPGWSQIATPDGLVPLSVAASGPTVLVGGSSPDGGAGGGASSRAVGSSAAPGTVLAPTTNPDAAAQGDPETRRPRLFRLVGSRFDEVLLDPQSPYGNLAQLVYLATDGTAVAAVGTATGGAHLNPRWTVWRGTLSGVAEQPQGMETFGGWNAGSLDGLALDPTGPLLIGSWSTGSGSIGTALWTTAGTSWRRDPTASALAGTAAAPAEPTGIAARGDDVLVSGFDIAGTTLRAGLWLGTRTGSWRRIDLPGAGADSVATGVACRADGCWVVGRIGPAAALWRVVGSSASRVGDLPAMTVAAVGQTPVLAVSDDLVWVAVEGSDQQPAVQADGRWSRMVSPGAAIAAVTASGRTLVAVTGELPDTAVRTACVGR